MFVAAMSVKRKFLIPSRVPSVPDLHVKSWKDWRDSSHELGSIVNGSSQYIQRGAITAGRWCCYL